jgi:hypothetical protein
MTRQQPLWQQAGSYAAVQDRVLLQTVWNALAPAGPGYGVQSINDFPVSLVANTMNVQIGPGTGALNLQAGNGAVVIRSDANEIVTLPAAPPSGQTRWDIIIATARDNAVDGGPNNDFIFTSVQGTPAASNAVVPALPVNSMLLAQVQVNGAIANLNGAAIGDNRLPLDLRQIAAKVYRAAAWTVAAGNIPFDTVREDVWRMWGGSLAAFSNYGLIAPVTGFYRMLASLSMPVSGAGSYQCSFYVNGGSGPYGQVQQLPGAGGNAFLTCIDVIRLNKGDNCSFHTNIAGGSIFAGAGNTFLCAQFDHL